MGALVTTVSAVLMWIVLLTVTIPAPKSVDPAIDSVSVLPKLSVLALLFVNVLAPPSATEIGRASCRERVEAAAVAGPLQQLHDSVSLLAPMSRVPALMIPSTYPEVR